MARSSGHEWGAEFDYKSRPVALFAGRDLQRSTDLLNQGSYDFHSKTFALSRIESLRQSRPVIQYR
jgi:hypothetical protein